MSDGGGPMLVGTSGGRTMKNRRLHSDPGCVGLATTKGQREARDWDLENLDECGICVGGSNRRQRDPDFSAFRALEEADPDEVDIRALARAAGRGGGRA